MKRHRAAVLLVVCLRPGALAAQSMPSAEAQAWRDDLRFMAQAMEQTHKNLFHAISRDAFAGMVNALDAMIPTLARHEVIYYWQEWHPLDTRDATSPSIAAPMTMDAYRANRDPALEAIQRIPAATEAK